MARAATLLLLLAAMAPCACVGSGWIDELRAEQQARQEAQSEQRRQEEAEQVAAAQVHDRSGMTFEQLREHLRKCRQVVGMPRDYIQSVIDEVVAQSPWPEQERALIRERKILVGFTEDQLRVAWGAPKSERRTQYSFGEVKYLQYFAGTTVHLKNGRVDIIDR